MINTSAGQLPDIGNSIGWLLYDNSCGFCDRWIAFWRKRLNKSGIETAPLQAPWVAETLGMNESELMQDVMILLRDRRLVRGADAYRLAMSRIWWAWPLYRASLLPILDDIFNGCYRTFATNRYRISHTCHLARQAEKH